MASPQKDDGFTSTANELVEQFARRRFSERDHVLLRYIERHTYGYQRKDCVYTPRLVREWSGMDESHVRKTVHALEAQRVVTVANGLIAFQKDYDLWLVPYRGSASQTGPKAGQVGPKTGQTGPGQTGPISGQVGPVDEAETGQLGPEKQAKPARSAGSKASHDANSQAPKERKKLVVVEKDTPYGPPGGQEEAPRPKGSPEWEFSETDLAVLSEATAGMMFGPRELAARIGLLLVGLVRDEKLAAGVVPAYHAMAPAAVALWVRQAIVTARAGARSKAAVVSYAASVLGKTLESGGDLLQSAPAPEASNVVNIDVGRRVVDARFAGKPWAHLWSEELVGTTCDHEWMQRQADRAKHFGKTCDTRHAMALFASQGVTVAMDYVWSHYPPREPARSQAAHVTA